MTFLPIFTPCHSGTIIPALSHLVPEHDNTDQPTSGRKPPSDLINDRAAITVVIYVLSWYLDLQAHPFQGLKSRAVISGAKGQRLDRLSLICGKV